MHITFISTGQEILQDILKPLEVTPSQPVPLHQDLGLSILCQEVNTQQLMELRQVQGLEGDFGQELLLVDCLDICLEVQGIVTSTTMVTVTMDRDTTSRGLGMALADQAGLAPITAGPLAGPQVVPTGEALVLRVPGPPQALVGPNAAEIFEDKENLGEKTKHEIKKARSSTLHHLTYSK